MIKVNATDQSVYALQLTDTGDLHPLGG